MKVREVGVLEGSLYSDNKLKVKAVFKKHGMKFNQGACVTAKLFLWQGDGIQAEGKFTKDDEGVTIRAEIIITSEERSEAFDQLQEVIEALGGTWSVVADEILEEEVAKDAEEERKKFMDSWKFKLTNEERNARQKGFKKSPIIMPLIKQFLEELEEKYGSNGATPDAVFDAIVRELESE